MRIPPFLLVLALASACGPRGDSGSERPISNEAAPPDSGLAAGALQATDPPPAVPAFTLRAYHSADGVLDSLWVMEAGAHLQTLVRQEEDAEPRQEHRPDFGQEDIDFDGVPDIWHAYLWGATGNVAYSWWLYDPRQRRFRYSPEFSERIGGHTLDPARKRITVRSIGGMAGSIFEEQVYEVQDGGLLEVSSITQDWLPEEERYVRTTRIRQGDRFVERTDTLHPDALGDPRS